MNFLLRHHRNLGFVDGLLLATSLLIIWSAVIYYLYALNWLGISLTLSLSTASYFFCRQKINSIKNIPPENTEPQPIANKHYLATASYLIVTTILVGLLITARSDQALISPWETVSPFFFPLYGTSLLLLSFLVTRQQLSKPWKLSLISLHYLISLSVAATVYIIGYGFDPFIHVATIELIIEKGVVLPKPPYYLGQYGLIVIIAQLTGWAAETINRFLVPIATALFLPPALFRYLSDNNPASRDPYAQWLVLIFLPILTFSPFILTTPQNLSYLFLILTVLSGYHKNNLKYTFLLATATTAIHPLTGLPALAWLSFLIWQEYRSKLNKPVALISASLLFLASTLVLPLTLKAATGASFKLQAKQHLLALQNFFTSFNSAGQEDIFLNTTYFLADNLGLFLFIITLTAVIYSYGQIKNFNSLLAINSALFISYLLSRGLEFDSLINYEQLAYANRIPIIIIIFFLPALLFSGNAFISTVRRESKFYQRAWLIFGIILAIISLYTSYPRFDKYWNSRGYSTSAADLKAVQEISRDATAPYIVLANQQVSAAALKELGFNNYHQTSRGEIYTYPIPTGGPLYKYYLDMVYYEPSRNTALEAASLAGVSASYLVVNKYWYQSGQIINAAKLSADNWWSVEDRVYIFKYQF